MSLGGAVTRPRRASLTDRMPAWSSAAWWAIGAASAFVLLTLWWLTQDRAVPYGDAAEELWAAFLFRDHLLHADVRAIFDYPAFYPPYGLLLGGFLAAVGGVSRNAVVLGINLVCVPLLALSCYRVGRLVAGPRAGALAVVFALGSPLVIEQFHVFMIDAPQATAVAVSVWLILISERFSRLGPAALAGVVVGIGIGTKEQFPLYLAGLVVVVLVRGGWRNVRGLAAFAVPALVIGAPWYVHQADRLREIYNASQTGEGLLFPVPSLARPALLSVANLEWFGWATLNGLLFAPLAAFAAVGVGAAIWRLRRGGTRSSMVPELLGGLFGSWLLLTILTHKDLRYSLPMIVYLAVLGTAWIPGLDRLGRRLAIGALVVAVSATTLGMTFGVGGAIPDRLPGNLGAPDGVGVPPRDRVVVYSNHAYLVSGPRTNGGVFRLLQGLRQAGAHRVYWDPDASGPEHRDFNGSGLTVLARLAGMSVPTRIAQEVILPGYVLLLYQPIAPGSEPCVRFADGMGVSALVGVGTAAVQYCPGRGTLGRPIPVPQLGEGVGGMAPVR
ncbi:MAG TPA: glycosyltransferase family 39 protein [Conexibacter sp.]|nr:glycosyltransferase family 39 protein [Conexibacter sp.]